MTTRTCLDNRGLESVLTYGREYIVRLLPMDGVQLEGDDGRVWIVDGSRFRGVER